MRVFNREEYTLREIQVKLVQIMYMQIADAPTGPVKGLLAVLIWTTPQLRFSANTRV